MIILLKIMIDFFQFMRLMKAAIPFYESSIIICSEILIESKEKYRKNSLKVFSNLGETFFMSNTH